MVNLTDPLRPSPTLHDAHRRSPALTGAPRRSPMKAVARDLCAELAIVTKMLELSPMSAPAVGVFKSRVQYGFILPQDRETLAVAKKIIDRTKERAKSLTVHVIMVDVTY